MRVAKLAVGLVAAWLVVLLVLGPVLGERTGRRVASRIGTSLQATATVGDASLGLVGGSLELAKLHVSRDDVIGKLKLDVGTVDCDLPPLGLALFDRTCGVLEVRDIALEVSTAALFELQRPKREPLGADRVIVANAELVFLASAFLPSLGRVRIAIERAEAGPTTFKTPLSFVFALRELRATIDLPAGVTLHLDYANGKLRASGSVLGSTPVELPIDLPVTTTTDDAQAEIAKLVAFGKRLAEQIVAQKAEDWIRKKLPIP